MANALTAGVGVCPGCGGAERDPIAPNFLACTSEIHWTTTHRIQVGTQFPWGAGAPIFQDVLEHHSRVCGHEFQEGSPVQHEIPICECGTYAVGKCMEDGAPVCGLHSSLVSEKRLCREHGEEFKRRDAAERAASHPRFAPGKPIEVAPDATWGTCRFCKASVPVRNERFAEFHRPYSSEPTTAGSDSCEGSNRWLDGA